MSIEQGRRSLMMANFTRSLETNAIEPIRQALQSLDVTEFLEWMLGDADRQLPTSMSTESYVHANGFYKVSLPLTFNSPIRAHLHVWPDGACADQAPDAHNHKYPFVSRILAGGLTHNIMQIRRGAGDYRHFKYVRQGDGHRYASLGCAALDLTRVVATSTGVTYSMDSRTVHMVQPEKFAYAATIVVELAPARNHTDVFVEDDVKPEGVTVVPAQLQPGQIVAALQGILART